METEHSFEQRVEEIRDTIGQYKDDCNSKIVESTALRLEGCNYAPPVITPIATFLRMNATGLLQEVDRVLSMPEEEACALAPDDPAKCQDLRLEFLRVILYYYEKLLLLREGDAEVWDEVDELYVHD